MSSAPKLPATISKLGLSRKIAILLIAPLTVQLLLFWSLSVLFEKSQRLAELSSQQTELMEGLDLLLIDRADAWGSILSRTIFNSAVKTISAEDYQAKIKFDFVKIRSARNPDPYILALIDEIERTYTQDYLILKSAETQDMGDVTPLQKVKLVRPALKTLAKMSKSLQNRIKDAIREAERTRDTQRLAEEQVRWQLFAGIALNLLTAAGTLLLFIRQLNSRLEMLAKNAVLVPKSEPLPYEIAGDDELALIDSVLHTAHHDLQEAKRHKQALTAMIAHDLRSPLMSVNIVIDSLLKMESVKESEQILRKAESLSLNMKRVFALVEDLLTVEKLESGTLDLNFDATQTSALIAESFAVVADQAKSKSVTLVDEGADLLVVGDRQRLSQVLVNYLSNALKFSPADSSVRVTSVKKGNEIIISVQDDGPGIPLDEQFELFEKFYRTPQGKQHKGFGLGLAICKMLITQHGGKVGAVSKPGRGSTFWFSVPDDD